MNIYSKNNELNALIEKMYIKMLDLGFIVFPESFKEIPYGVSLKFQAPGNPKKESAAVYFSEKKGFSIVSTNALIKTIYSSILFEKNIAGSDEAGKGDFFGPLVVCCFISQKPSELISIGVKDSKNIKSKELLKIYNVLKTKFKDNFSVVKIMPERYNSFYKDLQERNRNLNDMLAWGHSKVIGLSVEKGFDISKIIVDKFTKNTYLLNKIEQSAKNVEVEFIEKGEKTPAVAAASIIARGVYLESLEYLSKTFLNGEFELSSGSGEKSNEILEKIVLKYGKGVVEKIAKLHFKNVQEILNK